MPNHGVEVLADQPVAAQHEQQRDTADHRRQHQRQRHQRAQQPQPGHRRARQHPGQGHAEHERDHASPGWRENSESQSASRTSSVPRISGRPSHGARTSSPTQGYDEQQRADQRRDTQRPRGAAAAAVHQGLWKPASSSTLAPSSESTRSTNSLGLLLVLGARRGWRSGRWWWRSASARDLDALDLVAGGLDVGHVDDAGVDLAERDLGQDRLHVDLLGDRLHGDLGVGEDLGGHLAARDLRLAERDLDAWLGEVVDRGDLRRVVRRRGDLHGVRREVLGVRGVAA